MRRAANSLLVTADLKCPITNVFTLQADGPRDARKTVPCLREGDHRHHSTAAISEKSQRLIRNSVVDLLYQSHLRRVTLNKRALCLSLDRSSLRHWFRHREESRFCDTPCFWNRPPVRQSRCKTKCEESGDCDVCQDNPENCQLSEHQWLWESADPLPEFRSAR